MPVCVPFVSSRSGIVFNPSAGAITDHSQLTKDTDPYFKNQLYVEDPHLSVSQLILGLSLERSTLAYYIQFRDSQNQHAIDKTSVLAVNKQSYITHCSHDSTKLLSNEDGSEICIKLWLNGIVTSERKKRYLSTSDGAQNCAKLAVVRHEKRH